MMELDTIHTGDALDWLRTLPDESVDITITSPPYNLQRKNRRGGGMMKNSTWTFQFENGYENYEDAMPEEEYQEFVQSIVRECLRVSKGLVWVNHKTRYRDGVGIHPLQFLPFPVWSEVIWNRGGSFIMNSRRFAPSHEFVYGFGKPHYWNDAMNKLMSVWRIVPVNKDDGHPCPYPERLVERLVLASCPEGGTVLDPFMGSGTTAVVAQRLGRHYLGCDLSQSYCDLAQARLDLPFQPRLFGDTP
jgi:DNA modification methylase